MRSRSTPRRSRRSSQVGDAADRDDNAQTATLDAVLNVAVGVTPPPNKQAANALAQVTKIEGSDIGAMIGQAITSLGGDPSPTRDIVVETDGWTIRQAQPPLSAQVLAERGPVGAANQIVSNAAVPAGTRPVSLLEIEGLGSTAGSQRPRRERRPTARPGLPAGVRPAPGADLPDQHRILTGKPAADNEQRWDFVLSATAVNQQKEVPVGVEERPTAGEPVLIVIEQIHRCVAQALDQVRVIRSSVARCVRELDLRGDQRLLERRQAGLFELSASTGECNFGKHEEVLRPPVLLPIGQLEADPGVGRRKDQMSTSRCLRSWRIG